MYFLTELTWPQFKQLPHIKKLDSYQQQIRYHQYLNEIAQQNAIMYAQHNMGSPGGGHEPTPTPSVTPSISATPSVTPSISITPSVTPSVTPSISISPSITPSVTPSISVTPSVTPSPSGV